MQEKTRAMREERRIEERRGEENRAESDDPSASAASHVPAMYQAGRGRCGGGGECFIAHAANMDCPKKSVAPLTSDCG